MSDMVISLALDRYDRHVPFFLGTVPLPRGLKYRALEVGMVPPRRDGIQRHRRMLHDLEFDAAEVSLCSYIMAKSRGSALTGIPVFPRRLYSQNHIFVKRQSGIDKPADLRGRRVGLWAFQTTMSVLAKGDLKSFYGVPWEEIRWVTEHPEELEWDPGVLSVERAPAGRELAQMLVDGEIDAYIYPHPPALIQDRTDRVRRLFADPDTECARYTSQRGYYPIMHVIAVKGERLRERPSLGRELIEMYEEAKRQAYDFYQDPGYALVAQARNQLERQKAALGVDPWPSGFKANARNLQDFIGYMVDQRLLKSPLPAESLFHSSVTDT
jgi:4,5-dihydroxyphthalate decarboxylase